MSFNKGYSYCEIHTRPRPCCNSKCGIITTDMKIHYKYNQISLDQCILPTRFELYDDNILRLVWKMHFIVPFQLGMIPLSKYLIRFAQVAVAPDWILVKIGAKQNSEISCEPSLLPTDLENLGSEFNKIGIILLDGEILKIPDGQYENSPNVHLDWSILHHFHWKNWEIKKEKLKSNHQLSNSSSSSDESPMEAVDGTKRGYDTCGNFSFH